MRGKPLLVRVFLYYLRNIPAYAGKTWGFVPKSALISEHPRVCGENQDQGRA